MVVGTVGEMWRYPVKSTGGERLDHCLMGITGRLGDQGWARATTSRERSAGHASFPHSSGAQPMLGNPAARDASRLWTSSSLMAPTAAATRRWCTLNCQPCGDNLCRDGPYNLRATKPITDVPTRGRA
jgi:hypothetical protein